MPRLLLPAVLAALAGCGAGHPGDAPQGPMSAAPVQRPAPAGTGEIRSLRTSLLPEDCTTVSVDEEAGGSTQRCPGAAGYTLLALDGDARMSITVVDPAGGEHPLDYWSRVTGAFSSLGRYAEWRLRVAGDSAVPMALIVTLLANQHPDDPERVTPYRVIAKVTPTETCVTHRLPGDTPDAEVYRLADASGGAPCRESYDGP